MTRISRGKAEIDIELYDRFKEMEREFKKHSVIEFSKYGDAITFYSRDAFNEKQLNEIDGLRGKCNELENVNKKYNLAYQEVCHELQKYKAMPGGLIVEQPNVKDLSIFQFIKLKLRG